MIVRPVKTDRGWEIEYDGALNSEQESPVYRTRRAAQDMIDAIRLQDAEQFDELRAMELRYDDIGG